ncbi:MAG TPA: hypothetical protein VGI56_14355 [Galbitalea sp.]
MNDESKTEIDPRFDPAFQRGFDPSVSLDSVPAGSAAVDGSARLAPAPRPVVAAAPAPVASPAKVVPVQAPSSLPVVGRAPTPAVASELVQDEVVRLVDAPADDDATEDSNPARNPFLLVLGIIAVVLITVGVWLFAQTGQAFNSREVRSQGDYMTLVATIQMAPFIALLGGATAIGVIFMFAAKWRRHRASRND